VKVPLSPFLGRQRRGSERLVRELSREFPYVSLLASDTGGSRFKARKSETSLKDSFSVERGFVLRVHDGLGYGELSFNELPPDGPQALCRSLRERVRRSVPGLEELGLKHARYPAPGEQPLRRSWQGEVEELPEAISPREKMDRLLVLREKAFRLSPRLVEMRLLYEEVRVAKLFLSSQRHLEQAYVWSQGYLVPYLREGDETRYLFRSFSGQKGPELLAEMEAALEETLSEAQLLLGAGTVEPGEYEVILSPDVAGLLAHEAFGHGVEMDLFVKGRARAAAYLGRRIASPLVGMRDGAHR